MCIRDRFKIERGGSGEKIAYLRMFSGTVRARERLRFGANLQDKVTALAVFDRGPATPRASVEAGQIAKLWGLSQVQIGDACTGQGGAVEDRVYERSACLRRKRSSNPGERNGVLIGHERG